MAFDPVIGALIGTVVSTIGVPIAVSILNRRKDISSEAIELRDDLREQIESQLARITSLEMERDEWREKYFELRTTFLEQYVQLLEAKNRLKEEIDSIVESRPDEIV